MDGCQSAMTSVLDDLRQEPRPKMWQKFVSVPSYHAEGNGNSWNLFSSSRVSVMLLTEEVGVYSELSAAESCQFNTIRMLMF
jgi:hypothetical protein